MTTDHTLAVIAEDYGSAESFTLRPCVPGVPARGQVRVLVRAAGLSLVDVLTAAGKYQDRQPLPFVPGSEIAGVVEAVGPGVDEGMVGRRVIASSTRGALTHRVIVDADRCWAMPDDMDFVTGAAFRVSLVTAYEGLVRLGRMQSGESVVVLGASGAVGLAAVQLAASLGARVIASCSTAAKRERVAACGAHATVDSGDPDWRDNVRRANGGRPADIIFDPVGGPMSEPAFRSLAWGGRHLVVGFASGEIARLPTNLCILKGISLVGVNVGRLLVEEPGAYGAHLDALMALRREKGLEPVIGLELPLERFVEAMQAAGGGDTVGRIVVTMNGR